MKKRITWLLATFVAMLICLRPALAETFNIHNNSEFLNALEQAQMYDSLLVNSGTYTEHFYVQTDSVYVIGAGMSSTNINNGVIIVQANGVYLGGIWYNGTQNVAIASYGEGLTIANSCVYDKTSTAGIFLTGSAVLENVIIRDCRGGGVWCYTNANRSWGLTQINHSYLESNGEAAPALLPGIENGQLVYLPNNAVDRNTNFGAAIYMNLGSGQLEVFDSYIAGNSTNYLGGAIYAGNTANTDTCFVNLRQCTVIGNVTGHEGSVFWGVGKHLLTAENCLFMNNNEQQQAFVGTTNFIGSNLAWPGNHGIIGALVADPQFCDGYQVMPGSPCWPANNPSGNQIGAVEGVCTSVDPSNMPAAFQLTAYPNPFNPSTTIGFNLTRSGLVRLNIYDLEGHLVKTLLNEQRPVGFNSVNFDANGMSTGTYFCRLETNGQTTTSKLLLVK